MAIIFFKVQYHPQLHCRESKQLRTTAPSSSKQAKLIKRGEEHKIRQKTAPDPQGWRCAVRTKVKSTF